MAAKIIAALITLIANIAGGVVFFFFLLIAMNGLSESDANWGFGAYIILAIIVTLLMSTGAFLLVPFLQKKQFSGVVSALIAIPVFSIVGVGLKFVCCLIGIGIADYVRVNY